MNVRELLADLGIPFREAGEHHHVSQNWVGIDCGQCSPGSGRFRLGISLRSLAASCFVCGRQRLGDALAAAANRPVGEILRRLPEIARTAAPVDERPAGRYEPPAGVGPMLPAHRRYLAGRGFDPDQIAELWGVSGIGPDGGPYRWRLFLPAAGPDGKPASWTTRAVGADVEPRYLAATPAAESAPLRGLLYGSQHARHAVVVCEGPADCWAIGPGAVALCGLSYTRAQVAAIARYPIRAIAFDSEDAAQRRARQLAAALAGIAGETAVVRLSGVDPATSPADEIRELRNLFLS